MLLNSMGMYEDYTHLGTLILCHTPKESIWFQEVRTLLNDTPNIQGGVTQASPTIIVIRILGYEAEYIENILDKLLTLSC